MNTLEPSKVGDRPQTFIPDTSLASTEKVEVD
jgi:hypothetical protein